MAFREYVSEQALVHFIQHDLLKIGGSIFLHQGMVLTLSSDIDGTKYTHLFEWI
jgi:hypothetical protein